VAELGEEGEGVSVELTKAESDRINHSYNWQGLRAVVMAWLATMYFVMLWVSAELAPAPRHDLLGLAIASWLLVQSVAGLVWDHPDLIDEVYKSARLRRRRERRKRVRKVWGR
jgi:hypothetical protein